MSLYTHLSLEEREKLYAMREQGLSLRAIAKRLHRSQSSLTRELKRNIHYGNEYFGNTYLPCKAQHLADKRTGKQRQKAPLKTPAIFLYVREHLRLHWSPETIAGRLRIDYPELSLCPETIYQYIYARRIKTRGMHLEQYLMLQRKKRMKKLGRTVHRFGKIPKAISIELRPKVVLRRKQGGHWETDTIIGKNTDTSALSVTVERLTRFTCLSKLSNRKAAIKTAMLVNRLAGLPSSLTRTLTMDNGAENTDHQEITRQTGMPVFFCHAYHSWEKGTVENMNGRIRRFIPKGISLDFISESDIATIEHLLNTTPRKCLQYLTPCEMMTKLLTTTAR